MQDDHGDLYLFVQPNESAAQLLLRCQSEKLHTGVFIIDDNVSLRPGQFLEIVGPSSTGKTEILLQTAVNFLAQQVASEPTNPAVGAAPGQPAPKSLQHQVVYIDLDGKFDPLKLVQTLIAQLEAQGLQVGRTAKGHLILIFDSCTFS